MPGSLAMMPLLTSAAMEVRLLGTLHDPSAAGLSACSPATPQMLQHQAADPQQNHCTVQKAHQAHTPMNASVAVSRI